MTEMFVIKRVGFDALEKNLSLAVFPDDLGIFTGTEAEAQAEVAYLNKTHGGKYKGWDGDMYPVFQLHRQKPYIRGLGT